MEAQIVKELEHTQRPENLIVVDREWLKDKIRVWENYWHQTDGKKEGEIFDVIEELKAVRDNSYPLTPILEEAWDESKDTIIDNSFPEDGGVRIHEKRIELRKKECLSQPITLKNK